MLAKIVLALYN